MILAQSNESSYNRVMAHEHILVVDDDREITRLLRSYLEQAGYAVLTAHNGETAIHALRRDRPDLLILDLMLPDRDGWDVTRVIRADAKLAATPIIMLTARVEDTDKILGLELGADDYMTKPFNPREVLARVRAMLRRQQRITDQSSTTILQVGQIRVDIARHAVTLSGIPLELTRTEFTLLQTLMQNPGYVFTRSELIEKSLGHSYESIERSLDTHIKNLRRKVGDDPKDPAYIQTVYGVGYRLAEGA